MTLIDTIQKNNQLERHDIKTVKNASVFQANGIMYCKHYDTIIFAWDMNNGVCEVLYDLSTTSNRQISHLINALHIPNDVITDLNKDHKLYSKWAFGGRL